MKEFIIVFASIALGIILFGYIAGPDDDSIKSNMTRVWQHEIQQQSEIYP